MTALVIAAGVALIGGLIVGMGLRHRGMMVPMALGALFRLITGVVGLTGTPFRLRYSDADAGAFESAAWRMATSGWGAVLDGLNPASGFSVVSPFALIYAALGRQPYALVLYNVFLGVATIAVGYRLALELGGRRVARWTALVLACFPASILMSSLILRESGVAFGVAIGLLGSIESLRRGSLRYLALGLGGFMFAALLHGGMAPGAVAVLCAVAVLLFRASVRGARIRFRAAGVGVAAFAALVGVGSVFSAGDFRLASVGVVSFSTIESEVLHADPRMARGGSSYYGGTTTETWDRAVIQLPERVVLFLFSPLPWTVTSSSQVLGLIDGLLWVCMVLALLAYRREIWSDPRARVLLLFVVVSAVVYALGTTNAGTALRHRTKLIPAMLPLVLFAVARARGWVEKIHPAATAARVEAPRNLVL